MARKPWGELSWGVSSELLEDTADGSLESLRIAALGENRRHKKYAVIMYHNLHGSSHIRRDVVLCVVSTNTWASRVTIHMRLDGNLVQCDLVQHNVQHVDSNFYNLYPFLRSPPKKEVIWYRIS